MLTSAVMQKPPTLDEIFAVMSAASSGDGSARVSLPDEPDLNDMPTRFAIGLNVLLDDLAFRVAERERSEERLRQAQKLEAIGSLAGGVAHDFNNMLSVILGFTELGLDGLAKGDPLRGDLEEVLRAANRARELTAQLLAFSRRQRLEPRVVDLNAVLLGMEGMLRRLSRASIELSFSTYHRLGKLKADVSQLEQVIMNLFVNAVDAMPTGGKLTLETENVELGADYAQLHPDVVPGSYVMLVVSDTGVGMTPETRARLFEPFFTTKEPGKGTGLGLATVFGIVRQSGGHIWVGSELEYGTTFKVYFPRFEGSERDTAAPAQPLPPRRGSETVLLVEDQEQVRTLAKKALGRQGYNVLEAETPGDALLLVEQYGGKIHLLLTDVVMPRISGPQLAQRLTARRDGLKVLFMSGYSDESIPHQGGLDSRVPFLQKPFTPGTLLSKVREVLDEPETSGPPSADYPTSRDPSPS